MCKTDSLRALLPNHENDLYFHQLLMICLLEMRAKNLQNQSKNCDEMYKIILFIVDLAF